MGKRIDAFKKNRDTRNDLSKRQDEITKQSDNDFSPSTKNPFNEPTRDNYRTYKYDYFCASDCKVFFGDIWVDDIATIQYNVNQSKTPIYGYASQNFDAVARGQVIVQGNLTIQFKETGYLNIIQSVIESQQRNAASSIYNKVQEIHAKSNIGMAKYEPRLTTIGEKSNSNYSLTYSPNGTPQIIRQEETIEEILANKNASRAVSKNLNLGNRDDRDFEDFAEVLEDTIWGDSNGEPLSVDTRIKRADEFDYTSDGGIYTSKNESYANCLNILLTFGDNNDFRAEHTMTVLNDVHFLSTSIIVSQTGEPIGESYSFIARDINKSFSKEILNNMDPIKLDVGVDDAILTKLENVSNIDYYLQNQDEPQNLKLSSIASLDEFGWHEDNSFSDIEIEFDAIRSQPLIDQLISSVESYMNALNYPETVDPNKLQYMVSLTGANISGDQKINMILEQSVVGTRTYKVISPARTGFQARNIITRDDLLRTDLPDVDKEIQSELQKRDRQLLQKENTLKLEATEKEIQLTENLIDILDEEERKINRAEARGRSASNIQRRREDLERAREIVLNNNVGNSDIILDAVEDYIPRSEEESIRQLSNSFNRDKEEYDTYMADREHLDETMSEFDEYKSRREETQESTTDVDTEAQQNRQDQYSDTVDKENSKEETSNDEIQTDSRNETFKSSYATDERLIESEISFDDKSDRYKDYISNYGYTTAELGEAVTLLPGGHASDIYQGKGVYGTIPSRETLAMDVGHLIENNGRIETAGYITSRNKSRIYDKGNTTLYLKSDTGKKYSIHHLDPRYVQKFNENDVINIGDRIEYNDNHVHFQTESRDWYLEEFVRLGPRSYRNVKESNVINPSYSNYYNITR